MVNKNEYLPDNVSAPGETLLETLQALGMSQAEFSERTGRHKKTINEIIKGKAVITQETALQFESVLGIPAVFWNNREQKYREYLALREKMSKTTKYLPWLKQIPVRAMITMGWIREFPDQYQQLDEVLKYFGVASPAQWNDLYSEVAFRKSNKIAGQRGAITAWLRKGELEAQQRECASYDERNFDKNLKEIRNFISDFSNEKLEVVIKLCAQSGVALVFVPEIPKTCCSGATRWLSPQKALMQLSLRHKRDDHFWFTFFHEAGHIFRHSKRAMFLENDKKGQREKEANEFACSRLFPKNEMEVFVRKGDISKSAVIKFASETNLSPGVVLGQLQHAGYIPFSHFNDLKVTIAFSGENNN